MRDGRAPCDEAFVERALGWELEFIDAIEAEGRRFCHALGGLVGGEGSLSASRLLSELGADRLVDEARRPAWKGATARRLLDRIEQQFSFVIPREMAASKRFAVATTSLEASLKPGPGNTAAWYDLACMRAMDGRRSGALDALERPVELGFRDSSLLVGDPDLDSLRGEERFLQLADRLVTPTDRPRSPARSVLPAGFDRPVTRNSSLSAIFPIPIDGGSRIPSFPGQEPGGTGSTPFVDLF